MVGFLAEQGVLGGEPASSGHAERVVEWNTLSLPVSRKVREMITESPKPTSGGLRRKDDSERATCCGKFLELLAEAVGNLVPPPTALHSFASFGTKGAAKVCAHGECR